jgi:hypothetical protein
VMVTRGWWSTRHVLVVSWHNALWLVPKPEWVLLEPYAYRMHTPTECMHLPNASDRLKRWDPGSNIAAMLQADHDHNGPPLYLGVTYVVLTGGQDT